MASFENRAKIWLDNARTEKDSAKMKFLNALPITARRESVHVSCVLLKIENKRPSTIAKNKAKLIVLFT